jgi:hypothetical protein
VLNKIILPVEVSVCRIFPCERAKERDMHAAAEILNRKNAEASPFLIAEYEYTQHRYYFPQCGIQMRSA